MMRKALLIAFLATPIFGALATSAKADTYKFTVTNVTFKDGFIINGTFDVNFTSKTITDVDLTGNGPLSGDTWSNTPCGGLPFINATPICFDSSGIKTYGLEFVFPFPIKSGSSGNLDGASKIKVPGLIIPGSNDYKSGTYSIEAVPSSTPEPSSALLLSIGLFLLLRRKTNSCLGDCRVEPINLTHFEMYNPGA